MENKIKHILFKNEDHKKFYEKYLKMCRIDDVYHSALVYCLGINRDTRKHVDSIYSFEEDCVKIECLEQGWVTSGSDKVIRMAFNLYCGGAPSIYLHNNPEEQYSECTEYVVDKLFCSGDARYFWEAIKIRYPEYCYYDNE